MPTVSVPAPLARAVSLVSVALLAVLAAATLHAQPAAPAGGRPTRVAIVELGKVLDGLDERKDRVAQIEQRAADFARSLDELNHKREGLDKDLELLKGKELTPEFKKLWQERLEVLATGEARQAVLRRQLEEEKGSMLRSIFNKMRGAAQRLAERGDWDVVLRDDREEIPERVADPNGGMRAITGKDVQRFVDAANVLGAAPGVDITQALIAQLNNDYRAEKK